MPTDICGRTLFVNKIIRRYEDDVPAVKQQLREGEDRLLLDEISSLRAEVSRLSAELEGARKATIEEMALVAEECDIVMKLIVGGPDGASIARRCIAAAIRQKGERDES